MKMQTKPRVPSLRLHKPSGQAVVTIAGRDHYCGPLGSRKAQAEYQRLVGRVLGLSPADRVSLGLAAPGSVGSDDPVEQLFGPNR